MSMISRQVAELREWSEHENLVEENRTMADLLFKAADTIEMLSEKARGQAWIPCKERLPEVMGRYLCTVSGKYRTSREMYYAPQAWADRSDHATWRSIDGSYVFDWFVEAWMPLPEPYMKGADNE